jgi:hypothetical protein
MSKKKLAVLECDICHCAEIDRDIETFGLKIPVYLYHGERGGGGRRDTFICEDCVHDTPMHLLISLVFEEERDD